MRIANYGGAVVSVNGDRDYPGAGGTVGGLSAPGKGNAYIGGAGAEYNTFTPAVISDQVMVSGIASFPGGPRPRSSSSEQVEPPIILSPNDPPPGPIITPPSTPTTPTTPTGGCIGCNNQTASDPTGTFSSTATTNPTIMEIVRNLLGRTRDPATGNGPVYLFSPQPGEANGGFPMKQIMILGALAFGGFWLYKKYAA